MPDRDRDERGRARNARPRDGLGRPLPYDAVGVPRQPEGVRRSPEQTIEQAQHLLDSGRPFHAHEVFEDAWKLERNGPYAPLWKSLAQLAAGRTHQLRGNPRGADQLLRRAAEGLHAFESDPPFGLDVRAIRAWAARPGDRDAPRLRGGQPRSARLGK